MIENEVEEKQVPEKEPKLTAVMNRLDEFFRSNYDLRYNTWNEKVEYRPYGTLEDYRVIDERTRNSMTLSAIAQGIECYDRDVSRYLMSDRITEYHPLKHYLATLPKWDGRDRITELAQRVSDDPLWIKYFHRWMLAMVAQWLQLSNKFGNMMMPILVSIKQGLFKSTFCRLLLPASLREFYTDNFDITSHSNVMSKLEKFALINIDEMRRFSAEKMDQLKNFIQMKDLTHKVPYHNGYKLTDRLTSFIGTSNYPELLTDPTGSRRFFPIQLKERIGRLYISYRQVYAQLKEELFSGKRYWLTPTEEAIIEKRNKPFFRRPIEESLFFSLFRLPQEGEKGIRMHLHGIYETLKKVSSAMMRDITLPQFGEHLAMMGVQKERTKDGNVYLLERI